MKCSDNIAVTDDLPREREKIIRILSEYAASNHMEISVSEYGSAEGYLTELFCSCVCFPAVLLCYLPMKNRLKYGKKMTLACAMPALAVFLFAYHRTLRALFSSRFPWSFWSVLF